MFQERYEVQLIPGLGILPDVAKFSKIELRDYSLRT